MKKWLIGGSAILILFLIVCQVILPQTIIVKKSMTANVNLNGAFRFLSNDTNWKKWWPQLTATGKDSMIRFESGGYRFTKKKVGYNSFTIAVQKNGKVYNSLLLLLSTGTDSTQLDWSTTLHSDHNDPFAKISLFLKSRNLRITLDRVLNTMAKYISKVRHIYGINIKEEKIKIEFMVSTRMSYSHYPTTEDVYKMIGKIKKHMKSQNAEQEDFPIFHISATGGNDYELLVAIPVTKQLPDSGIFSTKKMLKNGNMLVTEITGGNYHVDSVIKQMDKYAFDHQYRNIALPFQSFITDRTKVTDSSKWLTRIGYPFN